MKIERLINDEGVFRCFAVDNSKISRHGMKQIVSSVPGVLITKTPRFWDDDVFCEFTYKGKSFFIEEPWGDNVTYDVVAPDKSEQELSEIALLFESTKPIKGGDFGHKIFSLISIIIGGVVFGFILDWIFS